MTLQLCEKRRSIIRQDGHLLVLGGPGSGKTTVALIKAKHRLASLCAGQEVLFLSFSRAAIRQVLVRCKDVLTASERRLINVQTYHAFCMDILRAHGRLLRGRPIRFIYPSDERVRKSRFDGDWRQERERLRDEGSEHVFSFFAGSTADLLEHSTAVRGLVAARFPMIIVDEFQDTDDDQWRLVRALASVADVFCLADPEQQIYDYRDDIDPRRLDILRETLPITEFDLEGENHRSPNAGILTFANAILRNQAPLPVTSDVKVALYWQRNFAPTVHAAVVWTFSRLREKGVPHPSLAVLARSNSLVSDLSVILSQPHAYKQRTLHPLDHDVVWDAELSAAAAVVLASILEWPTGPADECVSRTLLAIARFYQIRNADHPSKTSADQARKHEEAAVRVTNQQAPRIASARGLLAAYAEAIPLVGDPVKDWKAGRKVLEDIDSLKELSREARLVRLFRATDALASGLMQRWRDSGTYRGASDLVRRILEQERVMAIERDHRGCTLMSIHKAKGKEFDAVVLVEGQFKSQFFDDSTDDARNRRLLRVALTRARTFVTIVRPYKTKPLVDGGA